MECINFDTIYTGSRMLYDGDNREEEAQKMNVGSILAVLAIVLCLISLVRSFRKKDDGEP